MNQIPSNTPINQTSSIFDLLETFHAEFHRLRQQTHSITAALNSYIQNARTQDPHQFHTILANLGLSSEDLGQMAHIDSRFHRINDIIEEISQTHFQEQMALSSKYEHELGAYKNELSSYQEANIDLRTKYEQEKIHWQLEKHGLEEKVQSLSKELDGSRAALVENVTASANEERVNKKKMEMWFKRRLDAIEHRIVELKETPQDEKKFDELLKKVRGLKKKQPWNSDKKRPNLMLDDAALNQRSEIYSNGTSTPYSHYIGVLSSAATENNLLDKGFVCSIDNSFPATQKSQNSFLSEVPSSGMKNTKQRLLESAVRKLHDSRVSFSEKERLFCDVFRGTPAGNEALMHVKLDDILNAANISKSIDSLSLDMKSNGKPKYTFMFNQKLRLDDLKDTKLEKAISTIQSQGSQKSSSMFGTFKRSKSLDGSKAVLPNLEQLMELNMTNGEKQEVSSALDQGIIQEMSVIPDNFLCKESDKSLGYLLAEANTLKLDQNTIPVQGTGLSIIDNKKKDIVNSKFDELLISENSMMDDDFKNFLRKASDELDLSKSFKRNRKFFGQEVRIDKALEPEDSQTALEKLLNNLDLVPQKVVRASNGNMAISEQIKTITMTEDQNIVTPSKVKKAAAVPLLNFNNLSQNGQKPLHAPNSNIVAINNFVNPNNDIQQKENLHVEETESASKKTDKHPHAVTSTEEKPPLQSSGLPKTPIKTKSRFIEEVQQSNYLLKGGYNPRGSVDSGLIGQARPPPEVKRRTHSRPSLSLVENIKDNEQSTYAEMSHKPKRSHQFSGQDMSLDAEYPFNYHEQDDEHGHQVNRDKNFSFSIEQEQKFAQPPKAQFQTKMNSLLGRNTHTRQKTVDAFPPQKIQNQSHFIRSSLAQNQSQFSPYSGVHMSSSVLNSSNSQFNISCPSSKNSTQEAKFAQLVGSSGLNLLKKVLPSENSKRYPTPVKLSYKELAKKVSNENVEPESTSKETPVASEMHSYNVSKDVSTEKKAKRIKPTSPTRNLQADGKLGNIIQKKPKKGDEKERVVHLSAANAAMVSGSNQFRARMFAPKKV